MDEQNKPLQSSEDIADGENNEEEIRRPGQDLFEWLQLLMGCVLAAVIIFNCCARLSRVVGSSMDNTLADGEMMLIWSLAYQPQQGDIVVLNKTAQETLAFLHNEAIVKRVIAVGGQTVDIDYTTGTVYVDGTPLDEPYIKEEMYRPRDAQMQQTHWEVPEGSVFVMGDNRNASTDSRHEWVGTIDTDYLLGKAVLAIWPLSRIGVF